MRGRLAGQRPLNKDAARTLQTVGSLAFKLFLFQRVWINIYRLIFIERAMPFFRENIMTDREVEEMPAGVKLQL